MKRFLSVAFLPILAACSSPSPSTSSNWIGCQSLADCAANPTATECAAGFCVDSHGDRLEPVPSKTDAGPPAPATCDPLAPHEIPTTLGTILGIGRDSSGAIYVADEAPGTSTDRVFISSGKSLYRVEITGSGSSAGSGGVMNYSFEYIGAGEVQPRRALLIQQKNGKAIAMGLGPGGKSFIGEPGAVDASLAVLDPSAIAGMTIRNFPGDVVVEYVADVSDGDVLVVTRPKDDWTYTDFRVFYGAPSHLVAAPLINASRGQDTDISFRVGPAEYDAHFHVLFTDGGFVDGPGTIQVGDTTLQFTERRPVPQTLPGFTFDCTGTNSSNG